MGETMAIAETGDAISDASYQGKLRMGSLSKFYPALRRTLGAFLLAAATFKFIAAFANYSFPPIGMTEDFFHFSLAGLECVLGFSLIVGTAELSTWLMTLGFFICSVFTNIYWISIGKASCGCFGSIPVSPIITGVFSAAVLLIFLLFRPVSLRKTLSSTRTAALRPLIIAGLTGLLSISIGSPLVLASAEVFAPQLFDDRPLRPQSAIVDAGEGEPGTFKIVKVQLRNHSSAAITVMGGTRLCGCDVTNDLPVTIAPGGSVEVAVKLLFGRQSGPFSGQMTFYNNSFTNPELHVKYSGLIESRMSK